MFMLYAVPLGIAAGLALGGRLEALASARLRWVPAFVLAMVVQVALFSTPLSDTEWALTYGPTIYVGSLALVLVGLAANLHGRAVHIVVVGALCNTAVIAANGGSMPVLPEAMLAVKGHAGVQALADSQALTNVTLMDAESRLRFLGDVFAIPGVVPFANVFSVGDALAAGGVALWLVELMRAPRVTPR